MNGPAILHVWKLSFFHQKYEYIFLAVLFAPQLVALPVTISITPKLQDESPASNRQGI